MKDDAAALRDIAELADDDFDLFSRAVREMLARTYLIRAVDEQAYDFAVRNFSLLEAHFFCMGAELRKDEGLGVVAWRGRPETRIRLGREETCALLVLRLFYEEKRNSLSLTEFPTISVFDFVERYKAVTEGELRKTRLSELLRRLASYKLVKIPKDETDPDGQIILYSSLALALDQDGIAEIDAFLKNETGR